MRVRTKTHKEQDNLKPAAKIEQRHVRGMRRGKSEGGDKCKKSVVVDPKKHCLLGPPHTQIDGCALLHPLSIQI